MKYRLISVYDREIFTELFASKEEAQATMHEEMQIHGGVPGEIFRNTEYGDSYDYGFGEWGGFSNDGENHCDCDWLIVAL